MRDAAATTNIRGLGAYAIRFSGRLPM